MSAREVMGRIGPWLVLAVLWAAAFSLACELHAYPLMPALVGEPVISRLLGSSRSAFSEDSILRADEYFHRGIGHVHPRAITNDLLQAWMRDIRPHGHVHTEGAELRQIMPWLSLSIRLDPHNVDAYLTTAYWLRTALGSVEQADRLLVEAQRNNPGDYRVLNERARLCFGRADDATAAGLLDSALRLWPSRQDPQDQQTRIDKAQMLSYRAFLLELRGEREKAGRYFREALQLNPESSGLARRVAALERGENMTEADRRVWERVFAREMAAPDEEGEEKRGALTGAHHDHHDE